MLRAIRNEARRKVPPNVNLKEVITGATHTHAGPDFQGLWNGVPQSYVDFVIDNTAESVANAVEARERARFVAGTTDAPGLNTNRRGHPETDSTMTVLQARSASGGPNGDGDDTIATLANYAAHPVILGSDDRRVATDYTGQLIRDLEAEYGGTALFFNGAVGDASAERPDVEDPGERADTYGSQLADAAVAALDDPKELAAGLNSHTTTVTLLQENTDFDLSYRFGLFDDFYEFEDVNGVPVSLDTKVTRVTLGSGDPSIDLLTVPGEALTHLGLELRNRLDAEFQAILGLTRNSVGYFVPLDEWMEPGRDGNYEESVSFGKRAVPDYLNGVDRVV